MAHVPCSIYATSTVPIGQSLEGQSESGTTLVSITQQVREWPEEIRISPRDRPGVGSCLARVNECVNHVRAYRDQSSVSVGKRCFPAPRTRWASWSGQGRPSARDSTKNRLFGGSKRTNWIVHGSLHSPEGVRFSLRTEGNDEVDTVRFACRKFEDKSIQQLIG